MSHHFQLFVVLQTCVVKYRNFPEVYARRVPFGRLGWNRVLSFANNGIKRYIMKKNIVSIIRVINADRTGTGDPVRTTGY